MEETDRKKSCACGSGKSYADCCLSSERGRLLQLKGKKAEEFVYALSKKSFFSDWCFPNPKLPNGKEICDLLIVYNNIAVIWQIKDLKIDENGKYKPAEIQKNMHQLCSAKRRLFGLNLPIDIVNPRRGKERFNPAPIKEIYLISALLGEGEDYYSAMSTVEGERIHTFTREFTELILVELDTVSDFVNYLQKKEEFLSADCSIIITGGEKELLAYYLWNGRDFKTDENPNAVIINEGLWDELQKKPEFQRKKEEDRISYGWDEIINTVHTCGSEYELIARELARTNRFDRRCLSKAFFDCHVKAHQQKENTLRRIVAFKDLTYCFIFMDDPEPRTNRKHLLEAGCFIARGLIKENTCVLGIATEKTMKPTCTYDFCLLDIPNWGTEQQLKMERLQKELRVFSNYTQKHAHEDEYPLK